jgi:hypothetical protein
MDRGQSRGPLEVKRFHGSQVPFSSWFPEFYFSNLFSQNSLIFTVRFKASAM